MTGTGSGPVRALGSRRQTPGKMARRPIERSFAQAREDGAVADAERSLERRIRAHLASGAVCVVLTDNRYTMISVKREMGGRPEFQVRLHHMFADASPVVTKALALYVGRNDGDASRFLGEYIEAHQHRVRSCSQQLRERHFETRGEHFDLMRIFEDLNERYFSGRIDASITWGQRSSRPRRRNSIKMGSYSVEDRVIRIHRSLDRAFVPRYFIEWIVYHEMLHQVHEAPIVAGRRQFHTKAFLEEEARYEHYTIARIWERENLDALLTY